MTYKGCQEARLIALLKEMVPIERARFLMKYANAHAQTYEHYRDKCGRPRRRKRNPKEKAMSAERTDFVDTLPLASLKTGLAFVKGEKVGAKAIALAAENIFSYAAGQFLPEEIPTFTGAVMAASGQATNQEVEQAFKNVMPDDSGTMKAGVGKLDWATILKTLLPFILGLL